MTGLSIWPNQNNTIWQFNMWENALWLFESFCFQPSKPRPKMLWKQYLLLNRVLLGQSAWPNETNNIVQFANLKLARIYYVRYKSNKYSN